MTGVLTGREGIDIRRTGEGISGKEDWKAIMIDTWKDEHTEVKGVLKVMEDL
jgi:hypothetical protein